MLDVAPNVSDLIFSPGRPPQVEVNGQLVSVKVPRLEVLSADDTRRIASELLGSNNNAVSALRESGSCDVSYGLPGVARFRVNVFIQRGSCAVVMRVIPTAIPSLHELGLPAQLQAIAELRSGIVLVAGPAGAGKSSTLAAIIDFINQNRNCHVITIEDPIEFLHNHKHCTIHQRELHSDAPSFSLALKAALRQAPRVIMVGELRDRETIETVMEAAETGHLVLSSLHASDSSKAISRLVAAFPHSEQAAMRSRLARTLRYLVCQKLLPRADGKGVVAAVEILKPNAMTRECIENGENPGNTLASAILAGEAEGMQLLDAEIAALVSQSVVDKETAQLYLSNPSHWREQMARAAGR